MGAIVIDDANSPTRVMAARRTKPADLCGCWEFPGGKVEPLESAEDALRRELREELDVEIQIVDELRHHSGFWPISDSYDLRLYYALISSGTPTPGDSHDEVCWVERDELAGLRWLSSDRAAIPSIQQKLLDHR